MNYAQIHGDIGLEDLVEGLMLGLGHSLMPVNCNIPTPPPKKLSAIKMLNGKNRLAQLRNPT